MRRDHRGSVSRAAAAVHTRASLLFGIARFGWGVARFLRDPIGPEDAVATIRKRLERREEAFLDLLQHQVLAYRRSPYRALLRAAGAEFGDVATLVRREGIEGTLERLRAEGVHVDFEEFKGRKPAVRGSRTFHFLESDFDNPLLRPSYAVLSSGSRTAPTRTLIDLDYLADRAPLWCLWFAEHGLLNAPLVFIAPYYPGMVNLQLICAKFGRRFVRWVATARGGSPVYRLVTAYLHDRVRRAGGFPRAEFVGPEGMAEVGAYLADLARAGQAPCVNGAPSAAIRLGQALGGSAPLSGVTFLLGYEPLTSARREAIESTGARAVMTYGFSEAGTLGQQCRRPREADDVHVAADAFAVVQSPEATAEGAAAPLLLTSLRPCTPKVMLNADIGDVGILERRRCACLFEELGYSQHLHSIRSAQKMTGEGVTFLGPDLAAVLEETLPARFGGAPTDYQLLEEQSAGGLTAYRLVVSPDVGPIDETAVAETFLAALAGRRSHYRVMVDQWTRTTPLAVIRARPVQTAGSKLLPFRTLRVP